ncbi:DNA repair protein RecO [Calidifontibacillus erzurumensis]|uniref:DNA repair protein RecO n=1 Tax=Calidifontibacillus erzurumensis TaxID=2741433 RepID=A0A8J8GEA0_9BACI|nr:DNA repair protein RecO [Calidifontibacillus erzurumensis]NSL50296.1 DNA repair protein RecO [Calidifontibacillus erzurumensis]
MLRKVEGIVIRTTDYGETNKIVILFTREMGKIGVMARGAKKPQSRLTPVSQLFIYGHFLVQIGSGLGTLQQGEIISSFRNLSEDLYKAAYAAYLVELTDKLTEEKKTNPYLFELLYQTLYFMNEGLDIEILTSIYEMKMLSLAGIHPKLDGCASCSNTEGKFAFSIREGGFICHRCYHKDPNHMRISEAALKLLRLFYFFDLKRLGKISVKDTTKKEIKAVISALYDEYSGLNLKSKRFLTQLERFNQQ